VASQRLPTIGKVYVQGLDGPRPGLTSIMANSQNAHRRHSQAPVHLLSAPHFHTATEKQPAGHPGPSVRLTIDRCQAIDGTIRVLRDERNRLRGGGAVAYRILLVLEALAIRVRGAR
jgi:hypothetical protein